MRVVLGADDDEVVAVENGLVMPVADLQPNPENTRPLNAEGDDSDAEDLKTQGQLQNINIMSLAAFLDRKPYLADQVGPEPFVVINGCLRLANAKKAGIPGLRYEIHDEWTEDQIDKAVISENDRRRSVNNLHLGRHLARMVSRYGSERKLAAALGRTPAWVNHRIGLTKLAPELQDAIEADRITWTTARECPRLHPDLQVKLAAGELPESVVQSWLISERLPADEQLARWSAATAESGEYPVFTPAPTAPGDDEAAAAGRDVTASPTPAAADTAKRDKLPRRKPALVIRVAERSPSQLAAALRAQLTAEEITDLIKSLRKPK
ncbi:ParB/RepB/Spo0J family partition protein [Amycolatopsis sp. NPDC058986]|uniref:ParB/RepB/Spo0J family partition protein n=1 Tax=unclassified Amycolatopsis TaxID=2618356 RepID=UPI00366D8827